MAGNDRDVRPVAEDEGVLPDDVIFDDALDADDTLDRLDLADEPELVSADVESLENQSDSDPIDDDDNPYGASDEALPDEGEERELLRDPSGEATRFGERVR